MDIEEAKKLLQEMRENCIDKGKTYNEDDTRVKKALAIETVLEQLDWVTQEKEEWRLICEMQNQREYRSKFLKEYQKEHGKNCFPDYDEIYKRYDTQKDTIGKMLKDLDNQEKIINAMAKDIAENMCEYTRNNECLGPYVKKCRQCIKQYYERK